MLDSEAEKEHTALTFLKVMLIENETATVLAWESKSHPTSKRPGNAELSKHKHTWRIDFIITLETVNGILSRTVFNLRCLSSCVWRI